MRSPHVQLQQPRLVCKLDFGFAVSVSRRAIPPNYQPRKIRIAPQRLKSTQFLAAMRLKACKQAVICQKEMSTKRFGQESRTEIRGMNSCHGKKSVSPVCIQLQTRRKQWDENFPGKGIRERYRLLKAGHDRDRMPLQDMQHDLPHRRL